MSTTYNSLPFCHNRFRPHGSDCVRSGENISSQFWDIAVLGLTLEITTIYIGGLMMKI